MWKYIILIAAVLIITSYTVMIYTGFYLGNYQDFLSRMNALVILAFVVMVIFVACDS